MTVFKQKLNALWTNKKRRNEVLNYLIFGVMTTVVNFAVYYLFSQLLNQKMVVSNTMAWILSVLFAFFTNKYFVFHKISQDIFDFLKEIGLFFWFRVLSYVIDMALMLLMVDLLAFNDYLAKAITQVLVIILNYVFSKWFIFKKQPTK